MLTKDIAVLYTWFYIISPNFLSTVAENNQSSRGMHGVIGVTKMAIDITKIVVAPDDLISTHAIGQVKTCRCTRFSIFIRSTCFCSIDTFI